MFIAYNISSTIQTSTSKNRNETMNKVSDPRVLPLPDGRENICLYVLGGLFIILLHGLVICVVCWIVQKRNAAKLKDSSNPVASKYRDYNTTEVGEGDVSRRMDSSTSAEITPVAVVPSRRVPSDDLSSILLTSQDLVMQSKSRNKTGRVSFSKLVIQENRFFGSPQSQYQGEKPL